MIASIAVSVADLLDTPGGSRIRQALMGAPVRVIETQDQWARIEATEDGYQGWVARWNLADAFTPTHRVSALAAHLYPAPDIKSGNETWVGFGAKLQVTAQHGRFAQCTDGSFIPTCHLMAVGAHFSDPVDVALMFLGVPYLWGGNSALGIDCSGLVQASMLACGIECPGDSGPQCRALGTQLPEDAPVKRGDLFFWDGHVAIAENAQSLVHANAFSMATTREPVASTITASP